MLRHMLRRRVTGKGRKECELSLFPTTMLLLTETTRFHLDILDQFSAANVGMEKDNYVGISKTKDWAEKLATSKLLRPSVSHSI